MRRHPSGGLTTDQADVAANVQIDRDSLASGHCSIDSGNISSSVVSGDSTIVSSRISSSIIDCNRVTDSFVWASQLGKRVVVRSSHVEQCQLLGPIMVEGAICLGPWSLEAPTHLSDYVRISGQWTRPPRFFAGNQYFVVEGQDQSLYVGCKLRTFDYWLAHYGLGARLGEDACRIRDFILSLG